MHARTHVRPRSDQGAYGYACVCVCIRVCVPTDYVDIMYMCAPCMYVRFCEAYASFLHMYYTCVRT